MGKKGRNKSAAVVTATANLPKTENVVEEKLEIKKEVAPVVSEVKVSERLPAITEVVSDKNGEQTDQGTLSKKKRNNKKSKKLKTVKSFVIVTIL